METPKDLSLESKRLCQTLSKAFEMCKNIERTSSEGLQSNEEKNS